ncbi:hypothetical protein [Actinomadura madurae]|uniref:hypothetical protein n=1 Tax=Actinomadura madurae TaxID=1993 RepID=UPI0020D25A6C|nr:hypothetical protein [Actinomadura madurae]MCP9976375.1 hypothetical protein [Actinomadura madurae]
MTASQDDPPAVPEWAPEHEVTAEIAGALIGRRFRELRGASVEPLATGWDNTVFLVAGEWAFRFPRRRIAVARVERELAVLPPSRRASRSRCPSPASRASRGRTSRGRSGAPG